MHNYNSKQTTAKSHRYKETAAPATTNETQSTFASDQLFEDVERWRLYANAKPNGKYNSIKNSQFPALDFEKNKNFVENLNLNFRKKTILIYF